MEIPWHDGLPCRAKVPRIGLTFNKISYYINNHGIYRCHCNEPAVRTKGYIVKNDLRMLRKTASVVFVFLAFIAVMPAVSSGYIVEVNVASNCERELNIFCKHVTPGEGRLLACLYAYEDKLSGRCEYALYDASVHIQRKISNMMYLVTECADDFNKYCSSV